MLYRRVVRPTFFRLGGGDAESIHERVLGGLAVVSRHPPLTRALASVMSIGASQTSTQVREVFGLRFPNPIGLAAGFDKNAIAVPALAALGFGFIEIGTITRYAQPGNPKPRLFRLPSDEALINRMGFNNEGATAIAARLAHMPHIAVPLGVSLGKSKVTPLDDAVDDYLASLDQLYPYADYFAINISSPNTPGLRALQESDRLDQLLAALLQRLREHAQRDRLSHPKPLLVKVAPDLATSALDEALGVCLSRGANGVIAVNTTITRDALSAHVPPALRDEPGGLSGRPLHMRAVAVVKHIHAQVGDRLPIIGCGGIFTPDDAQRMFDAGASLLQIYTSFIYEGPSIARRISQSAPRSA